MQHSTALRTGSSPATGAGSRRKQLGKHSTRLSMLGLEGDSMGRGLCLKTLGFEQDRGCDALCVDM